MAASHVSNEYEKPECFYIHTPSRVNELTYLRDEDLDPNHTFSPSRVFIRAYPTEVHSIMDSQRGSSSRAPSSKLGDWGRCSVPHNELVALQTEGYLPPAFRIHTTRGRRPLLGVEAKERDFYKEAGQYSTGT